jgi:serine/threonine-protein phosphatase 4 regulatory subunit 1
MLEHKNLIKKVYDNEGYKLVTTVVVTHLNSLITDADVDVRRSASDTLAGLALHIRREDVAAFVLPIPMRLAHHQPPSKNSKKQNEQESLHEELRITAANLLAELGGAGENGAIPTQLIRESILPTVLSLCDDPGFRVRRAAAQALPRVLGGTTAEDAKNKILPAFQTLSKDEIYRVRKSTGECLVDMSRSLMILASKENDPSVVNSLRRLCLIPIAERLLADSNKFVRHGMMQFLGPFLASFYPYVDSTLHSILPGNSESDGSNHCGIVAQFFPHASSMVSRLNSSAAATTSAPTPILANLGESAEELTEVQQLLQAIPEFVKAHRSSSSSLKAIVAHRRIHAPDPEDLKAVMGKLLDQFVGLASANTNDENTDAEMRVYCAYSYPAVVLLLGQENWQGRLKDCFLTLLNPNYGTEATDAALPPLPVKRCLASSLHTVAHILGPEIAALDIMPIFRDHFLRDTDESVRLNMIRNFPTLLSLILPGLRTQYLLHWCETIRGEEVLGAMRRSAQNPLVLNWRQRDYVSRTLPDLICMADAVFVHTYLWSILKVVLTDSVNIVREDAIWAIPLLLKSFCPDNVIVDVEGDHGKANELWSAAACQEVVSWLKETILKISPTKKGGSNGKGSNFGQRQLYCGICAAIALAIRFGDGLEDPKDPAVEFNEKFKTMFAGKDSRMPKELNGPYQRTTASERNHLMKLLVYDILPVALEFKDDRVTNVRLTLIKVLHLMPRDLAMLPAFNEAVRCLEEEVETWESFSGLQESPPAPPVIPKAASMKPMNTEAITEATSKADRKKPSSPPKKKKASHVNAQVEAASMASI